MLYQNFIGIDIGKFNFVVNFHGTKDVKEYTNTEEGILEFIQENSHILLNSLTVLETTGGYESLVLNTLCAEGCAVHRANTRQVKNYIRSLSSNRAKTDSLDAKALSMYGYERHANLKLYAPVKNNQANLYSLVQRRRELKEIVAAEKNRSVAPSVDPLVKSSCELLIKHIEIQIESMSEKIKAIIKSNSAMFGTFKVLITVPGIGEITAENLLGTLPEIGYLTRRQIASLAGLAPRSNESGKSRGYRKTRPGREGVKQILFLSAMAARNSKSLFKEFYNKLIGKGKKKMVALVAIMRKILVIANARVRDYLKASTNDSNKSEALAEA